jgi:hypothetical protein
MPVVRSPRNEFGVERERLIDKLAQELSKDPVDEPKGDPLIFENLIQPTDRFFVIVIWSEWEGVVWGERSGIILEAYRRHDAAHSDQPPKAPRITTSVGMTWDQADHNAFFPYAITPNARAGEVNFDHVRNAMLEEGGVPTPYGVKLRFMSHEHAEKAFERLQQKLPNAHWSLNKIVPQS